MYHQIILAASLSAASTLQPQIEISARGNAAPAPSAFHAQIRTNLVTSVSGEAEFGVVVTGESRPAALVISLGVSSHDGAVLFTRKTGAPLEVGRYRVSESADDADEILALVTTGAADQPTGVYWGRSGWLVVTASSRGNIRGYFEVEGMGFRAEQPSREDRSMSVSGSFSANLASRSWSK